MIHRLLLPLLSCGFLFASFSSCVASNNDPDNSALAAAQAWLGLIDAGKYEESYDAAGQGLYEKVPDKKEWINSLKIIRGSWGPIVSRKETQHLYQPNGIVGLNGECMAISFDTATAKQSSVVEMVIMRYEDGRWRGVGYTIGSKTNSPGTGGSPAAVSQTSSQTIPSNKPNGQ